MPALGAFGLAIINLHLLGAGDGRGQRVQIREIPFRGDDVTRGEFLLVEQLRQQLVVRAPHDRTAHRRRRQALEFLEEITAPNALLDKFRRHAVSDAVGFEPQFQVTDIAVIPRSKELQEIEQILLAEVDRCGGEEDEIVSPFRDLSSQRITLGVLIAHRVRFVDDHQVEMGRDVLGGLQAIPHPQPLQTADVGPTPR